MFESGCISVVPVYTWDIRRKASALWADLDSIRYRQMLDTESESGQDNSQVRTRFHMFHTTNQPSAHTRVIMLARCCSGKGSTCK